MLPSRLGAHPRPDAPAPPSASSVCLLRSRRTHFDCPHDWHRLSLLTLWHRLQYPARARTSGCFCVTPWLPSSPHAATALSTPSPPHLVANAAPPPPPWARADEGDDEAADRRERHHLAREHHGQASGLHDPHATQGKAAGCSPFYCLGSEDCAIKERRVHALPSDYTPLDLYFPTRDA